MVSISKEVPNPGEVHLANIISTISISRGPEMANRDSIGQPRDFSFIAPARQTGTPFPRAHGVLRTG